MACHIQRTMTENLMQEKLVVDIQDIKLYSSIPDIGYTLLKCTFSTVWSVQPVVDFGHITYLNN